MGDDRERNLMFLEKVTVPWPSREWRWSGGGEGEASVVRQ
jgi:hypothetical protein